MEIPAILKSEEEEEEKEWHLAPMDSDHTLSKAGEDLTRLAYEGKIQEISHRDKEMDYIVKVLGMRKKGNPLVLGESGVGKTAIVSSLATRIVKNEVPVWLSKHKLIRTSFNEIWSLVRAVDQPWPEYGRYLREIIDFCEKHPVVLFMDEIHMIFEYPFSMNIFKAPLADGRIRLIGATTHREYQKFLARDDAVARRFEPIFIKEPTTEMTKTILRSIRPTLESEYKISISDDIIDLAIVKSSDYIHHRYQPAKSINLLERAAVNCAFDGKTTITKDDLEHTLSEITGIPDFILKKESDHLRGLESALNYRVLGQEETTAKIASRILITKSRSQLNLMRPGGVFLLTGPTGVGKTELAKALALHLTGSEDNLVRLDMSVYNIPGSSQALIGGSLNPEHPEVPLLTYQIRSKPNAVLLLDEMEKSCRDVQMLFLQIFDAGRILDLLGNEVFFDGTTILMTANIGFGGRDAIIEYPVGKRTWEETKAKVLKEVKDVFPPEFLGRIDDILVFKPLSRDIMKGFVDQKARLLESQNEIRILLTEKAIDTIIKKGFDEEYGARRLNHAIDELVGSRLAELKFSPQWDHLASVSFDVDESGNRLNAAPQIKEEGASK